MSASAHLLALIDVGAVPPRFLGFDVYSEPQPTPPTIYPSRIVFAQVANASGGDYQNARWRLHQYVKTQLPHLLPFVESLFDR
jgi:hypothetical protein